jgi:hypothetical protein
MQFQQQDQQVMQNQQQVDDMYKEPSNENFDDYIQVLEEHRKACVQE